jgi:hypothetical protein
MHKREGNVNQEKGLVLQRPCTPLALHTPVRRIRMMLTLPPGTPVSLATHADGRITLTLDLDLIPHEANETPLDNALVKL